jgi:hypothetical protein
VRSSWPAWASVVLGAAVALGLGSATSSSSLTVRAAPTFVRADGDVVAAAIPGDRKGHCAQIVLWRLGRAPVTIKTIVQCDNDGVGLDSIAGLALGGQTVVWQETNGGNNLELNISKATLTRPKEQEVSYVENGGGAAGDPAGDWTGALVGHDSLLAYASWKQCDQAGGDYARPCSPSLPNWYAQRLHRIGGRVLAWGPDAILSIWTDGKAILVRHLDHTLVLFDSRGRVLWRHSAVPALVGAVFQGSRLVTLTPTGLAVWDIRRDEVIRTIPLVRKLRVLEDLDGGIAVLGYRGTTQLIRLADGAHASFTHAANAQLEPEGLYFADGRTLRFAPRSTIRFG